MGRRAVRATAVVMTVLIVVLATMVIGHPPWAGPVVVVLAPGHGLHAGDLFAAAAWLTGAVLCWSWWSRTRSDATESG